VFARLASLDLAATLPVLNSMRQSATTQGHATLMIHMHTALATKGSMVTLARFHVHVKFALLEAYFERHAQRQESVCAK